MILNLYLKIPFVTFTSAFITRHRTYNFVFLLSVEGRGPLSLGRCRGFGLGPACRTLAWGTPRFRNTERERDGRFSLEETTPLYEEFYVDYIVCARWGNLTF